MAAKKTFSYRRKLVRFGKKQLAAIDFLRRTNLKPCYFAYSGENKRIVDSLVRRGVISIWVSPPTASKKTALVTPQANHEVFQKR
jgi:hypothetical protein